MGRHRLMRCGQDEEMTVNGGGCISRKQQAATKAMLSVITVERGWGNDRMKVT
jgi:hypothetical protein